MRYKMNILFFSIMGVIILLLILFMPATLKAQTFKSKINHYVEYSDPIEYAGKGLYGWEAAYSKGHVEDIGEYRKEIATLSPERFVRRIKMLFGVDITGHIDDKGHFYFSELIAIFPESQLIRIQQELSASCVPYLKNMVYIPEKRTYVVKSHDWYAIRYPDDEPYLQPNPREISFSDILLYCKWIYYNDMEAYGKLREGDLCAPLYEESDGWGREPNQITNKHLGAARFDVRDRASGNSSYSPIPNDLRIELFPPIREDVEFIQALNTVGRERITNNIDETNYYDLDFDPLPESVGAYFHPDERYDQWVRPFALCFQRNADEFCFVEKSPADSLRYNPYLMGFLIVNRYLTVPKYVSIMGGSIRDFLREHKAEFEKYDYFGCTLIREMAKTGEVDNSNIGVPHTAMAPNAASLRLDPQDGSIVFDTLHGDELFTVYEMGYDNYYLAQCVKPIEEWDKRDENGYAMCTGRMERVWGYVHKKDVILATSEQTPVRPFIDWGVVSDADGYVNLRDKSDASKIIEKIPSEQWVKILSYDMRNYLIETKEGTQGRIHKSRVIW